MHQDRFPGKFKNVHGKIQHISVARRAGECLTLGYFFSSVHTTRVHGPCLNTAREHGRHFWRPMNTGNRDEQQIQQQQQQHGLPTRPVNTGRVHGCPKLTPVFTVPVCPVNTGSVYRPLLLTKHRTKQTCCCLFFLDFSCIKKLEGSNERQYCSKAHYEQDMKIHNFAKCHIQNSFTL